MISVRRTLESSMGRCRFAQPLDDDPAHCRHCGWPIDLVRRMWAAGVETSYYRHRRPPFFGGNGARGSGSAASAADNPQEPGTILPLSAVDGGSPERTSDNVERGDGPKGTVREASEFPQPCIGVWTTRDYARFHAKHTVEPDGCWLWIGSQGGGYGQSMLGAKKMGAHHVAYRLYIGEPPAGLDLMHLCDVRLCVNPDHLEPGTRAENQAHASEAGRLRSCVLDLDTILAIRAEAASGLTQRVIAERHGVTQPTVHDIVTRKTWAHVEDVPAAEAVA